MPERYEIVRCEGGPRWEQVCAVSLNRELWTEACGIAAWAQVCYEPERLHVRLTAREEEPLARFHGETDMVCRDSCLEFFFCPAAEDMRYFNFEYNPNGALYLGFGQNRTNYVRLLPPSARELFRVRPFALPNGWGVAFEIPSAFVRLFVPSFTLSPGIGLRGNFYKCGDETGKIHYLAWNPVLSDTPDFHRPQDFGWLDLS